MANPQNNEERLARSGFVLLCIAALAFPFSVAVTNIALAGAFVAGLLSGEYARGLRYIWKHQRPLCIAWLAYLALFPLGLLWSLDIERGVQLIGRQWFWLLTPLVVELLRCSTRRRRFLLMLSLGLSLHLVFCLAQFYGLVTLVGKSGSLASNPAGIIGHTSFGFVYGIWAAFLLHRSLFLHGLQRWAVRLLALWAVDMVFFIKGRSGYLVVAVLLLVTLWKLVRLRPWLKMGVVCLAALAITIVLSVGPGKERTSAAWQSIGPMLQGNFQNPEPRWSLWYAAIEGWHQHMPLGVGTGGYHVAATAIKQQHPDMFYGGVSPAHPHDMLLQALTRWGPAGVLLLGALFVVWMRGSWRCDWRAEHASILIPLTGIALFVQGLTEASLEEHFSGVLAAMLLGAGIAARRDLSAPIESSTSSRLSSSPDDAPSSAINAGA